MLVVIAWLWALVTGASVPFQLGGTIKLNDTLADKVPHSMYVSEGCILVGALWLSLLSLVQRGERPQWPKRRWSWLGGIVVAPNFITTPAANLLGTQLVVMLMQVGMIGAALVFDCKAGRFRLTRRKCLGLLLLLSGVGLEVIDAMPEVKGEITIICFFCAAVLLAGSLFGLQAKMNKRLARDLGSAARAAAVCNASVLVWATPIWLVLRLGMDIPFFFRADDWWIWMLVGLQSAFYTFSVAVLTKVVGYSVVFVLVLAGKLVTAAGTDALGLFTPPMHLSPFRCGSIVAMVLGAIFYTIEPSVAKPSSSAIESVEVSDATDNQHKKALCDGYGNNLEGA